MKLYCPSCQKLLINEQKTLKCISCNKTYQIKNDIPRFIETDFYWGEIPQKQMQDVNKQIILNNWKDVLKNHPSDLVRSKSNFIMNLNRGNYHYIFSLNTNSNVLDIGSGLGTISEALSYYYDNVISIEPVNERIEFSSIRFKQENRTNISLIQTDLSNLPFENESFDLIIMNGILEWVGISNTSKSPEVVQLEILKKLHKLLKPGGILCIGIENRIGLSFFFGRIDHSWMPYTSLVPRFIANYITLKKKGYQYRTYTYTYQGYNKLLLNSGFKKNKFYYPNTGYNVPNQIIPLDNDSEKKYYSLFFRSKSPIKRTLKNLMVISGINKWLSPDFIIQAEKEGFGNNSKIRSIIKKGLKKDGYISNINNFKIILHCTSTKHVTYLILLKEFYHPILVVTISLREEYNKSIEHIYNGLKNIYKKFTKEIDKSIPKPILLEYYNNRAISIKSFISGNPLPAEYNIGKLDKISRKVVKWISDFYLSYKNNNNFINENFVKNNVLIPLKSISEKGNIKISDEFQDWINKSNEDIICDKLALYPQHGDFWHGNIVIDKSNVGVFDWEFFGLVEVPLFDLFHFLTMYLTAPDNSEEKRKKNFYLLFSNNEISNVFFKRIKETADFLNIDFKFTPFLYFLYLLNFYDKISKNNLGEEINNQIIEFIEIFIKDYKNFILNKTN